MAHRQIADVNKLSRFIVCERNSLATTVTTGDATDRKREADPKESPWIPTTPGGQVAIL